MTDAGLTIEIKNSAPIELVDLTQSLLGLADEFRRHLDRNEPEAAAADVRLYVKEIRTGSVIADLIAISPQLFQAISYANAIGDFHAHLKTAYEWLSGKSADKPKLDKTSYENLIKIVELIAKDHKSQINIGTAGNVYILNSTEANAAQNTARKELEKLREPLTNLREKVVLYWYQARADATSKAGDRGIIESISPDPVKVICANDRIKAQMILDDDNPFKSAYLVDVFVETIQGKPAVYKIFAIHEKLERE